MKKEDYLKTFELMTLGMIEKNRDKLEKSLSKDSKLIHMTGKSESREEYIVDILNGTLNYYDYKIISFNISEAVVQLKAKVYGSSISWWTLKMNIEYIIENDLIKIKKCKVGLG